VLKALRALDKEHRCVLGGAINGLQENPLADGVEALEGFSPTRFRLRKGDYRIIFERDDKRRTIVILKVGDRKEVYKK